MPGQSRAKAERKKSPDIGDPLFDRRSAKDQLVGAIAPYALYIV